MENRAIHFIECDIMMEESAEVRKIVHRKMKDITISNEFRNFVLTVLAPCAVIWLFFGGRHPFYEAYEKREKIDVKKLYTAILDAVEKGGKEVRKDIQILVPLNIL